MKKIDTKKLLINLQGCDASILVDPSEGSALSEMSSSRNFGVRKREAIGLLKSMVEEACPEAQVSCADILILAAREAVAVAGGPRIKVPLGRRDSWGASRLGVADSLLPSSTIGVDGMLQVFAEKGMSLEESVAIMGWYILFCGIYIILKHACINSKRLILHAFYFIICVKLIKCCTIHPWTFSYLKSV